MRPKRRAIAAGGVTVGVMLAAGSVAGTLPAGGATLPIPTPTAIPIPTPVPPPPVPVPATYPAQSTVQKIAPTVTSTVNSVAVPMTPSVTPSLLATIPTSSLSHTESNPLAPLTTLPLSPSGPITGPGATTTGIGTSGSPGNGVTLPITLCGIEGALSGTATSLCPKPAPTAVPVSLASTAPAAAHAATPAAAPSSSALAHTGAPLLLELAIGASALLLGVAASGLGRRRSGRHACTAAETPTGPRGWRALATHGHRAC